MKEKVDCIMSGGIAVFYGKGDNFYFRINKTDKGFLLICLVIGCLFPIFAVLENVF